MTYVQCTEHFGQSCVFHAHLFSPAPYSSLGPRLSFALCGRAAPAGPAEIVLLPAPCAVLHAYRGTLFLSLAMHRCTRVYISTSSVDFTLIGITSGVLSLVRAITLHCCRVLPALTVERRAREDGPARTQRDDIAEALIDALLPGGRACAIASSNTPGVARVLFKAAWPRAAASGRAAERLSTASGEKDRPSLGTGAAGVSR